MRGKNSQTTTEFIIREFVSSPRDAEAASEILRGGDGAAPWSARILLAGLGPKTWAYLSERGGEPTGFIIGRQVGPEEGEVLNLAVRKVCRRQGEGSALVHRLLDEFRRQEVQRAFLEVRESNLGARAFYEHLGFRVAGRREHYYQEPTETAIVMEMALRNSTI